MPTGLRTVKGKVFRTQEEPAGVPKSAEPKPTTEASTTTPDVPVADFEAAESQEQLNALADKLRDKPAEGSEDAGPQEGEVRVSSCQRLGAQHRQLTHQAKAVGIHTQPVQALQDVSTAVYAVSAVMSADCDCPKLVHREGWTGLRTEVSVEIRRAMGEGAQTHTCKHIHVTADCHV